MLYDYFKKFKDKNVLFLRACQGNWGDGVIRLGAYKLASLAGLTVVRSWKRPYTPKHFKKLKKKDYPNIDLVYVHGSGGIGTTYTGVAEASNYAHKVFNDVPIIYGPSTIMLDHAYYLKKKVKRRFPNLKLDMDFNKVCVEVNDYLIKVLNKELEEVKDYDDFVFFARERTSYDFLKENFDFKVELDHCPSLYLKKEDLGFKNDKGFRFKNALLERVDLESFERPSQVNPKNFDVVLDPVDKSYGLINSYSDWIFFHNEFDEIFTNRLHSAIIGNVLGKKVSLWDNCYHKNKSVWEHSLKSRGVEWIGV